MLVLGDPGCQPDGLQSLKRGRKRRPAINVSVLVKEGAAAIGTNRQIAGAPEEVAEQLARFVSKGFSFLNLSLSPTADGVEQRERLAREVLPILRPGRNGP